jgi:hypothetical protein
MVFLAALVALYIGTAVVVTIVEANKDAKAVLGACLYYAVAVGLPLVVGRRSSRSGAGRSVVVCRASVTSLLAHLAFLPVALAVFARETIM